MPLEGEAKPRPKSAQLARGQRRYRRKVASPKQWQAIIAAKQGPCRVCVLPYSNGQDAGRVELHHLVKRGDGGDDVPENIVPLHSLCHRFVEFPKANPEACRRLLESLTDAEYAYMIERGGEDYPERAYGIVYAR
jgi:hypothetical protein